MSNRAGRAIVTAVAAVCGLSSGLRAEEVVTHPYPGITLIQRKEIIPLPAPNANPNRQVRMNIVVVDLNKPEVRFKMTPPTPGLPGTPGNPEPAVCVPQVLFLPWPCPAPPMEVVKRSTLAFLEEAHAQVAINSHFFAPFPIVNTPQGQAQSAYAYAIGLAASRGNVYSAFEYPDPPTIPQRPIQNYAIMADSPAVNIDPDNHASIVHRDPAFPDGKHVLEPVTLWNALSGSGQIITNGVKTIPCYLPDPGCSLVPPGNGNPPYSNANSWYNLVNARSAIGISEDGRTLYLFTVDIRPNATPPNPPAPPNPDRSQGMRVGEVADVLLGLDPEIYPKVHNALNLDGGGSTSMAMQDNFLTADQYLRRLINTPSDNPPRAEATNLAVYSDGVDPITTAAAVPGPNANGWNKTDVAVGLAATDLRSGNTSTLPGWVDQLQYSMEGAQTGTVVVPGQANGTATASVGLTTEGATTVTYFATDAAGNDEGEKEVTVRIDRTPPAIFGMPSAGCSLWPPNHWWRLVAFVAAHDTSSGMAHGGLDVTVTSTNPSDPRDAVVLPVFNLGYLVFLKAEGGNSNGDRVYTITANATDRADNVGTAIATCTVPRHH